MFLWGHASGKYSIDWLFESTISRISGWNVCPWRPGRRLWYPLLLECPSYIAVYSILRMQLSDWVYCLCIMSSRQALCMHEWKELATWVIFLHDLCKPTLAVSRKKLLPTFNSTCRITVRWCKCTYSKSYASTVTWLNFSHFGHDFSMIDPNLGCDGYLNACMSSATSPACMVSIIHFVKLEVHTFDVCMCSAASPLGTRLPPLKRSANTKLLDPPLDAIDRCPYDSACQSAKNAIDGYVSILLGNELY